MSRNLEFVTVEARDGTKLEARVYKPNGDGEVEEERSSKGLGIVMVHPYSLLGGVQGFMKGIASGLAANGYLAITYDMRGAGRSAGKATIFGSTEVNDVVDVCKWVSQNLSVSRVLLVGSSAGAAIAGSAVDLAENVVGYVSIGYPFGMIASVLFGRHNKAVLQSSKPKLFIMGTKDGFTSVKQLEEKLKSAAGRVEKHFVDGISHFQMEGPIYDSQMVDLIHGFIESL